MSTAATSDHSPAKHTMAALALGALGVVYGDIGTSPLYAIRECFAAGTGVAPTRENVLGILSLVFWTVTLLVTLKYVILVLRADNRGEGGALALMALTRAAHPNRPRLRAFILSAGLIGTALFFGDAILTPAISVLSAIEGLEVATDVFRPYIAPIAIGVIAVLFLTQRRGTASVGRMFGPVMFAWFAILGVLGIWGIMRHPDVLMAINPAHAAAFVAREGWQVFLPLGAVFLAITGAEALYADLGHFGAKAIRTAWFLVVMPGLVLNYFGQGAIILDDASAVRNPFFLLPPSVLLYPMVAIATAATVIASQAVISGAFSLFNQAIQLGLSPRTEVQHTSPQEIRQVYLPQVNLAIFAGVVILILSFGSSSALASAYGIAVSGTMVVTSTLAALAAGKIWNWPRPLIVGVFGLLLLIDVTFLAANLLKVLDGGWVPIAIAIVIYVCSSTWIMGRAALYQKLAAEGAQLSDFINSVGPQLPRVRGTAAYMARIGETVPHALLHNIKHNKILHERILLLTVLTEDMPIVLRENRVEAQALDKGFWRITVRYGFLQSPNLPRALGRLSTVGLAINIHDTSFFLGRVTLVSALKPLMPPWRRKLYFALARNAASAPDFFRIPTDRVVEVGAQIAL
ncbi:MAG: potassium transporter Kup [Alphaproteobacteria bacterium]|nr:potassium transporter Kup [Alphaproteobacteria bacterium]